MSGDIKAVVNVRGKVLKYFDFQPNEIHPHDLNKLRNDEWMVERFLVDQGGKEEAAAKALIEALKWRKTFGLHERNDDYFPSEFYKVATLFPFTRDRNGNQMLFFRVKQHRRDSVMIKIAEMFIAHQVNKIDEANPHGKWCVIFDMTGAGLASVDMSMCNFLIDCIQYRFPRGPAYTLVYGMPWIMQQFLKLARTWMEPYAKRTTLLGNGDDIFNYATPEVLPTFIGGKNTASFRVIPATCKTGFDCDWLPVSKKEMTRLVTTVFKKQLAEAEKESLEIAPDNDLHDDINLAKKVYEEEMKGVRVGRFACEE